jgi:hypothetical protein
MNDDSATSLTRSCSRPLRLLGLLAAFALAGLAAAPAQAHGRLGAAEGRCRLFVGPDIMNFTGYLPEASKNEFCEDIPSTGPMIMVLDAEQEELRDMKVELRIIKDVGAAKEEENLEAVTVAYKPPRVYPTGTINFEHTFNEGGYFVGVVTVTGDHGERWVSRFPFSVDRSFMRDLPAYLTLGLGVIAAFVIYLVHRRRSPPPQIATAAAAFKPPPNPGSSFGDRDDATRSALAESHDETSDPDKGDPGKSEADRGEANVEKAGEQAGDPEDADNYKTAAE